VKPLGIGGRTIFNVLVVRGEVSVVDDGSGSLRRLRATPPRR
jgi:hypothetical protein